MGKIIVIALSCAAVALSGCERLRPHLPAELARHLPGAEAPPVTPAPMPEALPVPAPAPAPSPPPAPAPTLPSAAADPTQDLPVVPQGSLVDSLLAAGSVAANLLQPAAPGSAPLQAQAAPPTANRADKALALLRAAGLQLPDGAVVDDGARLVLRLEAADADHYEEELVTQWALGFAVLAALGAREVAVITAVDGTPMVEIAADAKDIAELAAEAIDSGEFFRRARFTRLGPAGEVEEQPDRPGEIPAGAAAAPKAKPAQPSAAVRRAPDPGRAPANRAPSTGRAAGAGAPYQRANSGRAPR